MPAHDEESHQLLSRSSFDIEDPDLEQLDEYVHHRSSTITSPAEPKSPLPAPSPARRFPVKTVIFHGVIIVCYALIAFAYTALARQSDRIHGHLDNIQRHAALPSLLTSIPYTIQPFGFDKKTPFTGAQGSSSISAWDELLALQYLNVSAFELKDSANYDLPSVIPRPMRFSVDLPGGGKLASLGAWTELACVRRLWEANHRDAGMNAEELKASRESADQCVERLRQAAMCRADADTLSSYEWKDGSAESKGKPTLEFIQEVERSRCVDWEQLAETLKSRVVPPEAMQEMISNKTAENGS